jgi:site-specific DNA-methyltransferase (adenine-specific)
MAKHEMFWHGAADAQIITADCVDGLRALADGSVQCCVTSPPYWNLRNYGADGQIGCEATPEEYAARLVAVLAEVRRVLRQDGTLFLNIGDTYRGGQAVGIPWRVAFALVDDGWNLVQDVIWHKPNPMPGAMQNRCVRSHEYVFVLAKGARWFFDPEGLRDWGHNRHSVWKVPTASYRGAHFAAMPPALARLCIVAGTGAGGRCDSCGKPYLRTVERIRTPTRPGMATKSTGDSAREGNRDPQRHVTTVRTIGWAPACLCDGGAPVPCAVLDPFAGSGTTLAESLSLGRSCVGIELNAAYVELIRKRINRVQE